MIEDCICCVKSCGRAIPDDKVIMSFGSDHYWFCRYHANKCKVLIERFMILEVEQ